MQSLSYNRDFCNLSVKYFSVYYYGRYIVYLYGIMYIYRRIIFYNLESFPYSSYFHFISNVTNNPSPRGKKHKSLSINIENARLLNKPFFVLRSGNEIQIGEKFSSHYLTSRLDSINNQLRVNIKLVTEYWIIEVFIGDV